MRPRGNGARRGEGEGVEGGTGHLAEGMNASTNHVFDDVS